MLLLNQCGKFEEGIKEFEKGRKLLENQRFLKPSCLEKVCFVFVYIHIYIIYDFLFDYTL